MERRQDFWKGLVAGAGIGAALAVWLRGAIAERSLPKSSAPISNLFASPRPKAAPNLQLRRDASENAGDPARLISTRGGSEATFTRRGGAPGGRDRSESLEIPGRPGQTIQNEDRSEPIHPSRRAIDFNKS
jgi:hypothetical protein